MQPIPQHSAEYAARICPVFRFLTGSTRAAPDVAVGLTFDVPTAECLTAPATPYRFRVLRRHRTPGYWECVCESGGHPAQHRSIHIYAGGDIQRYREPGAAPAAPELARLRVIGRIEPPAFRVEDFPGFTVEQIRLGLTVPATSEAA